jgi:hypothetical protein
MTGPAVACIDCGETTTNACGCCDDCIVVRSPLEFTDPVQLRKIANAFFGGPAREQAAS